MASEKSPLFEWHFSDLNHSNFHIDSRGLLLVLFFFSLIFIITTLSFYARWACIRGRLSTTTSRATNIASLPQVHQSLGLDAAAIDNLPVVLHRSVVIANPSIVLDVETIDIECCICLGVFEGEEKVKLLISVFKQQYMSAQGPTGLGHLWHAGRARAATAGFEKGIGRDFEPVLSMTPLN
ncbi:hypothetical protein DVH24_041659 [Malus domestica]|uniref:RING-type domain-containing protein n=1 Tax=Malus domestica TaxID=3750 RepID=A0A498ITZ2_MALDO|nr:hypothetical protein DVH24_041659 [Malus domestica]